MRSSATCISTLLTNSDPIESSKLISKSNVNSLRYFWSCERIKFCWIRLGSGGLKTKCSVDGILATAVQADQPIREQHFSFIFEILFRCIINWVGRGLG